MCAHAAVSRAPDPASRNEVRSEWRRWAATGMILLHCAKLEREYKCFLSMTCQCAHVQKCVLCSHPHVPACHLEAGQVYELLRDHLTLGGAGALGHNKCVPWNVPVGV